MFQEIFPSKTSRKFFDFILLLYKTDEARCVNKLLHSYVMCLLWNIVKISSLVKNTLVTKGPSGQKTREGYLNLKSIVLRILDGIWNSISIQFSIQYLLIQTKSISNNSMTSQNFNSFSEIFLEHSGFPPVTFLSKRHLWKLMLLLF